MKKAEAIYAAKYELAKRFDTSRVVEKVESWRREKKLRTPARVIVAKALEELTAEQLDLEEDQRRALVMRWTLHLVEQLEAEGDYKGARAALADYARLAGLHEPTKTKNIAGESPDAMPSNIADKLRLISGGG